MSIHPKEFKTVYVVKNHKTYEVIIDEIIEVSDNSFKSIKFRHTFYKTGDFFSSRPEALEYCRVKKLRDNERGN